jgi:hypothetical protein
VIDSVEQWRFGDNIKNYDFGRAGVVDVGVGFCDLCKLDFKATTSQRSMNK